MEVLSAKGSPSQYPWTTFRSDSNSQSCNIRWKMRKDEYIKEDGLKIRKKGILGKVAFLKKPCIFFLLFSLSPEKVWNKSCGNGSSYCSNLFWWNLKNEGIRAFLHESELESSLVKDLSAWWFLLFDYN